MKKINFTEEQQAIIDLMYGKHLVLAPPGTGKTELLSKRIVKALELGFKQKDLICLTFTNRAADNMKDKVTNKIGENEIYIGNMHGWCSQFLYKKNIIARNSSLLDEEDSLLIIDDLKKTIGIESKHRAELLKFNTYVKQKTLGFPDVILSPLNREEKELIEVSKEDLSKFHNEYEKIKKDSLYIDFDDLLTLTYDYLRKDKNISSWPWLQVDEVQDLNPMHWAIINLITNEDSHRVFFGDYEQAIFSFMGAKTDSLKIIEQNGAQIHNLSKNFRSPEKLLKLFNTYATTWLDPQWKTVPVAAISIDKEQLQQPLQLIKIAGDPYNEALWVVNNKLPREPKHRTAILVRTNKAADMYAWQLDQRNLKYFKVSGFDIFKRKEVKDIFAFYQTLLNVEDRRSWSRVLWLYGKVKTLEKSRQLINSMFKIGMRPTDFIESYPNNCCFLDYFYNSIISRRIVVFDVETTGLDVENDDIIQIAAIEIINGKPGKEFDFYINTEKDLTESERIHHISKEYLDENAISKTEALLSFMEFVGNDMLVAHNIQFDKDILIYNLKREGLAQFPSEVEFINSIDLATRLYPDLKSYKLEYLISKFNIEGKNTHNALDDAHATVNLLLHFKGKINLNEESRNEFIREYDRILQNFKQRYSPLYAAITGEFSNQMPLHEVTAMVLNYMESLSDKGIDENVYAELEKITQFMKEKCKLDKVLNSLKEHVPEFLKYTEVDLALGNEKIFIATIHKAKGLEFENVIIPQLVDETFPFFYSKTNEEIKEDARLLYVAMTRSKTNLLLTFHTSFFGHPKTLSPFIKDQAIKTMFFYKEIV